MRNPNRAISGGSAPAAGRSSHPDSRRLFVIGEFGLLSLRRLAIPKSVGQTRTREHPLVGYLRTYRSDNQLRLPQDLQRTLTQ